MAKNNTAEVKKEKLEVFIREKKYEGNLPCFYSIHLFPELEPLKKNWKAISDEVTNFEINNGTIKENYSNPYLTAQVEGVNWSNLYIENFMWRFHKNRKLFPVICSVIDQIPNCTLANLAVLSPNSSLKPHYGDTNGIIRCHLGLKIPEAYPVCGIRVGEEEKGWSNGDVLLFTEAHLHSVWNYSSEKRYVLIVDIVPYFIAETKIYICSKLLAAQTFNYLENRFPLLKKIPNSFLGTIHFLLFLMWRIYLPIQRRIKFL